MTMVNCLTIGRVGYMMADTAIYRPNLEVIGFADKIHALPDQKMLVTTRGEASLGSRFADAVQSSFEGLDAFLDNAETFLRDFDAHTHPLLDESLRLPDGDGTAVFIVGLSARREVAECWTVGVDGGHGSLTARPLALDIEKAQFSTAPSPGHDRLRKAGVLGARGLVANPEGALLHVAELQRWTGARVNDSLRYFVGGEVVLATVSDEGIRKSVVKNWGDEAGALIVPKELPPPPESWLRRNDDTAIVRLPITGVSSAFPTMARAA